MSDYNNRVEGKEQGLWGKGFQCPREKTKDRI